MRRILFYIVFIVCSLPALAQEDFVAPPAKLISSFSFKQFTGGVIMIQGLINNIPDTLNFILDTGSAGISLDSSTCDYLKLPTVPSDRIVKGIGGTRNVRFTNDNTLHLPGLDVEKLNFHINDYEILHSVYGVKIDGIIGFSFLIRYIVKLDYDSLKMYVYSPGEFKYNRGGYILNINFSGLPAFPLRLKEQSTLFGNFYIDTGAGLNFLLSKEFSDDSSVFAQGKKMTLTQAEGIGGKMQMYLTTVREIKVGPYRFRNVPAYVFDDQVNVTSYPAVGGLLGNDILRRFNVVINYRRREIHLVPNSHYDEPFDYAYTGLCIYYDGKNVVIEDIMKDSPGEKAGFKSGDIIYGVNNYVGNNIQMIKDRMQVAGERIKVLIIRDGKLEIISMKVGSVY